LALRHIPGAAFQLARDARAHTLSWRSLAIKINAVQAHDKSLTDDSRTDRRLNESLSMGQTLRQLPLPQPAVDMEHFAKDAIFHYKYHLTNTIRS